VFQAVVVGAGYATGRELVQFFMQESLATGLVAMATTAVTWGATLAIALANARIAAAPDYRSFLRSLIGPLWLAYEACFAALLIVVLSVLASAAGEIVHSRLGLSSTIGVVLMLSAVCALVFFGTSVVERFLTFWSVALYVLFALILAVSLFRFGPYVTQTLTASPVEAGWFTQGVAYAGYNLAVVPGILYCSRHLRSTREALVAGGLAGLIAILPAVLFFVAMTAFWPAIRDAAVPIDVVLEGLALPWLSLIFYVALFGIFIKTGAALIHAVNERIAGTCAERGRPMPAWVRPAVAVAALLCATLLAEKVGIVDLIAQGYQILTVAFLFVFVLPLIIVGGWRVVQMLKSDNDVSARGVRP
jgi:uncharacterized membrane protein YkvI